MGSRNGARPGATLAERRAPSATTGQRKSGARGASGAGKSGSAGASARVQQVPASKIHVGLNPREHFDKAGLEELAASIKAHGLLQPITVRPHVNGYQIIAGERRFRAMTQINGDKTVPVIVRRGLTDEQARNLALIENINRVDMRPTETAKAYQSLMQRSDQSAADIARQTGKSVESVQHHLELLSMSRGIQASVDEGRLPMSIVHGLHGLSERTRENVADRIISQSLGVRAAKALIRAEAAREAQPSMFAGQRANAAPSKVQLGARDRYTEAVSRLTNTLSHLDDETVQNMVRAIGEPQKEAERLRLMANQLNRMSRIITEFGYLAEPALFQ